MTETSVSAGRALRHVALPAIAAALALTGCSISTEEPTERRIETWRWNSVQVGDGPAQTVSTHSVEYKPIVRGPEWDLQAQWFLRDRADNKCPIRLDPVPLGENRFMTTLGKDCSEDMARIAAWRLQGDTVLLVDAGNTVIGTLHKRSWLNFTGSFTLRTGKAVEASLARL